MSGLDFADPERGICGALRPSGAAVFFDHDQVLAASAEAGPGFGSEGGAARVDIDGVAASLELAPMGEPIEISGDRAGSERLAVCRVLGELTANGKTHRLACLGVHSDITAEADADQVSLTRSIAVAFSDGGLLALRAARPQGAAEHGDEEVVAAVASPEGELIRVREALVSTQYDPAGRQVRATLELWPEEGDEDPRPPLRAAGSIVCGTSLALGDGRLDLAFFRWSMDGRPGLGRYEVLAAAGD
jgi:hypothetical protein